MSATEPQRVHGYSDNNDRLLKRLARAGLRRFAKTR